MKILHVTPHLGGGVGKAHASLCKALPKDIEQTFLLLEEPRDPRYAKAIEADGSKVVVSSDLAVVADLAGKADIVQFEFWNHPRLFECLARCRFPAIRSVFWSHISGLSRPVIQPGLIERAGRFVFTTPASLTVPSLASTRDARVAVVNSGFGFDRALQVPPRDREPAIAYLGTVDFVKMHPGFFDVIDRLAGAISVRVWGGLDPTGPVAARAEAMRNPDRIVFCGQTEQPDLALAGAGIFFYPLQPHHYGTSENALIEAMSLGLAPLVLDNPAEKAIVRDAETGYVARSIEECVPILQMLLLSPESRERISLNAARDVAATRTPARSAQAFVDLWRSLLEETPRRVDFGDVVGESPADWLIATQCLPGETWTPLQRNEPNSPSKGTLAHFEQAFTGDASLSRLQRMA